MGEDNPAPPAVETSGLVKRYSQEVLAVDSIDLRIPAKTIYALLGPNGAGKTTTVSMLTTICEPSSGRASVLGFDVVREAAEVRRRIGVTFQEMVLDKDLTGRQALDFHGRLYRQRKNQRRAKIDELLTLVEMEDAADRKIATYSGGMKRRLELARGLMTQPEVLFLDEPTTGLDPQNRYNIWEYIRNLKEQQGLTLLLTTHYMEEAEALADRVGIIDHGKLVTEGTPREMIDQMGADSIAITGRGNTDKFRQNLNNLAGVETVNLTADLVQIGVDHGNQRLAEIVALAASSEFQIDDISVAKPSLGDVFLKYTGRKLRDT